MNPDKLGHRLEEALAAPERLPVLAGDVARLLSKVQFGSLSRQQGAPDDGGERGEPTRGAPEPWDDLFALAAALATRFPADKDKPGYWSGYAAALRDIVDRFEQASAKAERFHEATQLLRRKPYFEIAELLERGPQTGSQLAKQLKKDPGGLSRILERLRDERLADTTGDPAGHHKPHILTSLGVRCFQAASAESDRLATAVDDRSVTWGERAGAYLAERAERYLRGQKSAGDERVPDAHKHLGKANLDALYAAVHPHLKTPAPNSARARIEVLEESVAELIAAMLPAKSDQAPDYFLIQKQAGPDASPELFTNRLPSKLKGNRKGQRVFLHINQGPAKEGDIVIVPFKTPAKTPAKSPQLEKFVVPLEKLEWK